MTTRPVAFLDNPRENFVLYDNGDAVRKPLIKRPFVPPQPAEDTTPILPTLYDEGHPEPYEWQEHHRHLLYYLSGVVIFPSTRDMIWAVGHTRKLPQQCEILKRPLYIGDDFAFVRYSPEMVACYILDHDMNKFFLGYLLYKDDWFVFDVFLEHLDKLFTQDDSAPPPQVMDAYILFLREAI